MVKRLFKIQNINASTIRTVMVAHCRRHDNPDLLLDYEAQSRARRQKGQQQHHHQPLLFDLGTSGSEDEDEEVEGEAHHRDGKCHGLPTGRFPQPTISGLEHVIQVRGGVKLLHFEDFFSNNTHHSASFFLCLSSSLLEP